MYRQVSVVKVEASPDKAVNGRSPQAKLFNGKITGYDMTYTDYATCDTTQDKGASHTVVSPRKLKKSRHDYLHFRLK